MRWNEKKRQEQTHVRTLNDCFSDKGIPAGTHGRVEPNPSEQAGSVNIRFYPGLQPVSLVIKNVSRDEYESSLVEGDFYTPPNE
jgi:hypothetical protein